MNDYMIKGVVGSSGMGRGGLSEVSPGNVPLELALALEQDIQYHSTHAN